MATTEDIREINRYWLQRAYEEAARRFAKRSDREIGAGDLLRFMRAYATDYAAEMMEIWWNTTLERVPHDRLRYLYPLVRDLFCEMGIYRGGEGEDPAPWVACALAYLRWWHQSCAGRFPEMVLTKGEVEQWLAENAYPVHANPAQPSLFKS